MTSGTHRVRRTHGVGRPHRTLRAVTTALLLLAGAAAVPLTASPAAAAKACPQDRPPTSILVTSMPTVPGATIRIEKRTIRLDGAGQARITVCRLLDARSVKGPDEPVMLAGKRRAVFDRVFLSDAGRRMEVAFGVEHQVSMSFLGLPNKQITAYTLRSSTGEVHTYNDFAPVWLLGSRVLRGPDGLEERDIYYSVDSVLVHGSSVVNRSKVKFFPDERQVVRVKLLSFDVQVFVVDRLFRFAVGDEVTLKGPDGLVYTAPVRDGKATFRQIPRNTYDITADAPGLKVARNLTLSQNQIVVLPVFSWLDLLVLVGGPAALAVALVLAPRPLLRRRILDALGRLRPSRRPRAAAPDDAPAATTDTPDVVDLTDDAPAVVDVREDRIDVTDGVAAQTPARTKGSWENRIGSPTARASAGPGAGTASPAASPAAGPALSPAAGPGSGSRGGAAPAKTPPTTRSTTPPTALVRPFVPPAATHPASPAEGLDLGPRDLEREQTGRS